MQSKLESGGVSKGIDYKPPSPQNDNIKPLIFEHEASSHYF